jgi:hypothetical protein
MAIWMAKPLSSPRSSTFSFFKGGRGRGEFRRRAFCRLRYLLEWVCISGSGQARRPSYGQNRFERHRTSPHAII